MSFPHLHVASDHSHRYGVTSPEDLVEQAAAQGADFLANTDRDGLHGAVRHLLACRRAGIRSGLGANLAVHDHLRRPLGRVVVLAHGGTDERGYGALCRAVSAAHEDGGGAPSISRSWLAELAGPHALTVLIGPGCDVGEATGRPGSDDARSRLDAWSRVMPPESVCLEVVCHLAGPGLPGSVAPATRMLALAERAGVPAVLTNAVRYGTPEGAVTADLLDAVRGLTTLGELEHPQSNGQAWLKPAAAMRQVARMIVDAGQHDDDALERMLRDTERLADRCALDPVGDVGIGGPRMPDARITGATGDPVAELWRRARHGIDDRYAGADADGPTVAAAHARLERELETAGGLGVAGHFLAAARVAGIIRGMGIRVQAHGPGVGSMLNYALGTTAVEPVAHDGPGNREPYSSDLPATPGIAFEVEFARRDDIDHELFRVFGAERIALTAAKAGDQGRGALRDTGAALGLGTTGTETARVANQLGRFEPRSWREALGDVPELEAFAEEVRASDRLGLLVDLTALLDRLPPPLSPHPQGVILSDVSLRDRTPVQRQASGLPMSQFDTQDLAELGIVAIEIRGVRIQSAMAHAIGEHRRLTGAELDHDELGRVPLVDQPEWLRTHHPAEFLAGLFTHDPDSWPPDRLEAEADALGVTILGLDVQHSAPEYRTEKRDGDRPAIRLALPALSGTSTAERARIALHQPFTSLQDFRDRVRPRRRAFEALTRAGALDAFVGYDEARRHELLAHIQSLRGTAVAISAGQIAFDVDLPVPDVEAGRGPEHVRRPVAPQTEGTLTGAPHIHPESPGRK